MGWTCSRGSPRCVEPLSSAYWASLTRPGALAQTGRKVRRLGVRRAPPRGAQRTAPGAGCSEHARGSRRPRRCRCGEEFRGLGRRIAAALGRRRSAGWPCRRTCVETWRSSGEAVGETSRTIARHSPARRHPRHAHGTKPCAAGMPAGLDVPRGRDRARQAAAAVVAAAACEQGQESAPLPSRRAGCPGAAQ